MKRVTGGAAPAEIWKAFMAPVLPHIRAEAIPGGVAPGPAQPDLIGNLIDGAENAAPAAEAPIPDEAPQDGGQPPTQRPDNPSQSAQPPF
jgi:penicillin-binding protein 1A